MMESKWLQKRGWKVFLLITVIALLFFRSSNVPPIWFDEGWGLSLARNWVQVGHYGHLQLGQPVPSTILNTGFTAIAPLALSFKLFGIGLWQARLPGMLFTLGALCVFYYLACRIYDQSIASMAVVAALFLSIHPDLHPILIGRQALGEMPAVFYLLAGYALFLWAWDRPCYFILMAPLFWAFSLQTKPQIAPFFLGSSALSIAFSVIRRYWTAVKKLTLSLLLTLLFALGLTWLWGLYLQNHILSQVPSNGSYTVLKDMNNIMIYVVVLNSRIRIAALEGLLLLVGMPTLIGLIWSGWRLFRRSSRVQFNCGKNLVKLMLWSFTAGSFLWYLFLSIGWPRYLFPAAFIGNIFIAAFLYEVTAGFDLRNTMIKGATILHRGRFSMAGWGVTIVILFTLVAFLSTAMMFYRVYSINDDSLRQVTEFLNTTVRPDELMETYESELFFLLDCPYHYPPDAVQHELNRRTFLGQDVKIKYDPLLWNPDYIVIGPSNGLWHLYDPILRQGQFERVYINNRYQVYKKIP